MRVYYIEMKIENICIEDNILYIFRQRNLLYIYKLVDIILLSVNDVCKIWWVYAAGCYYIYIQYMTSHDFSFNITFKSSEVYYFKIL